LDDLPVRPACMVGSDGLSHRYTLHASAIAFAELAAAKGIVVATSAELVFPSRTHLSGHRKGHTFHVLYHRKKSLKSSLAWVAQRLEASIPLGVVLAVIATELSNSALPGGMVSLPWEAEALVGTFSFPESFHGAP
jgi:hypothetical protein